MKRALVLVVLLLACNSGPVGFDQLRDRVPAARDTTVTSDSSGSYERYVPLSPSDRLYLGRDSLYQSRILIRFALPDTLTLDSISLVQLVLHPLDSTRMAFVCVPCSIPWDSGYATWLMYDNTNFWQRPGGDLNPETLATGTLDGDTLLVDFRYPTGAGDSVLRATIRTNGVALLPLDTGFATIWAASASLRPSIRVSYGSAGAVKRSFDAAATTMLDTMRGAVPERDLLVGSGVALRTWLHFNLDSLPSAATVARADLSFRPIAKYRRAESLPIGAHRLTESYAAKGANARFDSDPFETFTFVPASDSDTVVTLDLRGLVQDWIVGRDSTGRDTLNFGLLVTSQPEWSRPFRLRIPVSGPGAPRLQIEYVMPPEDRFWHGQ